MNDPAAGGRAGLAHPLTVDGTITGTSGRQAEHVSKHDTVRHESVIIDGDLTVAKVTIHHPYPGLRTGQLGVARTGVTTVFPAASVRTVTRAA